MYPKPEPHAKTKRRADRKEGARVRDVRAAVFERDGDMCRVCGAPGESLHELQPRSLGGTESLENSVCVCGSGTTKCHGALTSHQIRASWTDANLDVLFFDERTRELTVSKPRQYRSDTR